MQWQLISVQAVNFLRHVSRNHLMQTVQSVNIFMGRVKKITHKFSLKLTGSESKLYMLGCYAASVRSVLHMFKEYGIFLFLYASEYIVCSMCE